MKTARHHPTNGLTRHLRDTRLFRKLLKAHHAATYDNGPTASTALQRVAGASTPEQREAVSEKTVTEIQVTLPPPSYHEIPDPSATPPPIHEVPRFRPTVQRVESDIQTAYSVASIGTAVLSNIPLLSSCSNDFELLGLDDMHFARSSTPTPTLTSTTAPSHRPRSADNNVLPSHTLNIDHPAPATLTRDSPLGSHPVQTTTTATTAVASIKTNSPTPTTTKPPPLKRMTTSHSLIASTMAIMSPIREEEQPPHSPVCSTITATTTTSATPSLSSSSSPSTAKRPPSILRLTTTTTTTTTATSTSNRHQKRVRFSQLPPHSADDDDDDDEKDNDATTTTLAWRRLTVLLPTVVMAVLILLANASQVVGALERQLPWVSAERVEYALAFAVGCGVAHVGLGPAARAVEGTLGRAREEGWL